jgi:hypothetical protein
MNKNLHYRITGPQSVDRLDPILLKEFSKLGDWKKAESNETSIPLDFVWETTCELVWRCRHNSALIINKLHNSQILESKANLAYLQQKLTTPMLSTLVALSPKAVLKWCTNRWSKATILTQFDESINHASHPPSALLNFTTDKSTNKHLDLWVVKASNANGGRDIWFINSSNFENIIAELPDNTEFVIQKYVENPKLLAGKKFHFRCYTTMFADSSAYVYEQAFILTSGLDYSYESEDALAHITNLSVNKRLPNHPGQITVNLSENYPQVTNPLSFIQYML